ncbi:hypothetical protein QYE76_039026 [Lolium multiflorum]|uniref:Integrase catalytic domain-containing protein n=1 Tax=Lolium multiflorum TaxID=4521 RepID=A0AAD8TA30_LOLMU|nr:hypothetical protein QYE76_039026 [Lolium multiflorum]
MPLYQLMREADKFVWSPRADEAFRDLKRVLSTAPILATGFNGAGAVVHRSLWEWLARCPGGGRKEAANEGSGSSAPVYYLGEVLSQVEQGITPLPEGFKPGQIERRGKAYTIINHKLAVKRSVSGVFRRCVEPAEVLREIHQGECGHHASLPSHSGQSFPARFFLAALREAEDLVKGATAAGNRKAKANAGFRTKNHPHYLDLLPYGAWNMVGPFKTAGGGMSHLLVMIDKFTKWIEAKPIKKLDGSTGVTFLKEIIARFGYPHSIITDKGSNFAEGIFKRYCREMGIRMDISSVAHPETNGQVEKANGLI